MPIIPPIQPRRTLARHTLRRNDKTPASERIRNNAQDAMHKRDRRLKNERRLQNIKINFDRRRQSNRRRHSAAEHADETDNNNVGQHINTQA